MSLTSWAELSNKNTVAVFDWFLRSIIQEAGHPRGHVSVGGHLAVVIMETELLTLVNGVHWNAGVGMLTTICPRFSYCRAFWFYKINDKRTLNAKTIIFLINLFLLFTQGRESQEN